jgi:hypothetical protein
MGAGAGGYNPLAGATAGQMAQAFGQAAPAASSMPVGLAAATQGGFSTPPINIAQEAAKLAPTNLAQQSVINAPPTPSIAPAPLKAITDIKLSEAPNLEKFGGRMSAVGQGLKNITASPENLFSFVKENPVALAGLASSIAEGMQSDYKFPEREKGKPIEKLRYAYDAPVGVSGGRSSERNYFPSARFESTGQYYMAKGGLAALANGGPVEQMSRLNAIGANTGYPMANQMSSGYSTPAERPISENIIRPQGDAKIDPYTGQEMFAEGGAIEAAYQQLLGRAPDPAGLAFYSQSNVGDRAMTNEQMRAELANSPEALAYAASKSATRAPSAAPSPVVQSQAVQASAPSGYVNVPQGATYIGGGLGQYVQNTQQPSAAVESPFANYQFNFNPATGGFGPSAPSAPQGPATPDQVADLYERVLGRQPDLPGLEYYARQQKMSPATLEKTLRDSPEYFTSLTKPLVPEITFDDEGYASIEGAPAYNPAQYGFPGEIRRKQSAAVKAPVETLPPISSGTTAATGTTGSTSGGTTATTNQPTVAPTAPADPNAYKYDYFQNTPAQNAAVRQFQSGPNDKARSDLVEMYLNTFNRLPDQAGFDYYMNTIGKDNVIDKDEAALFMQNAKQELDQMDQLRNLYGKYLQREADLPGQAYWMSEIGRAGGVTPEIERLFQQGAQQEVQMGDAGYRPGMYTQMGSRETPAAVAKLEEQAPFRFGPNDYARQQLVDLYEEKLGRLPDQEGFNYWLNTVGADNRVTADEIEKFMQAAQPELATKTMAIGGLSDLGAYSDGGRLLKGPGDGVSDSIPAVIGERQPARLADGEFVIPARIVSELGNGSTDAGARKLYAMMDRIQSARKKSVGKGKVAANTKSEKYLPA